MLPPAHRDYTVKEFPCLTIEGDTKTGDIQTNMGTSGHFSLVLNMLTESLSTEYLENIEGSAKHN